MGAFIFSKMSNLQFDHILKGDLAETIFQRFCLKNNYAYVKLESVYNGFTPSNILTFKFHFQRIEVKIPMAISRELWVICRPSNKSINSPSFCYDYLTLSLSKESFEKTSNGLIQRDKSIKLPPKLFNWVEVKYGESDLTSNQKKRLNQPSVLDRHVYRIHFNLDTPITISKDKKWSSGADPIAAKKEIIRELVASF